METYGQVKKVLSGCGIDSPEDSTHKIWLNGFPYWSCKNWQELSHALGYCAVPHILSTCFDSKSLVSIDVYDDFVWENEKYRWPVEEAENVE